MFGLFKNIFSRYSTEKLSSSIQKGAALVDVRTPSEFYENSVPLSINIPLAELQQKLNLLNPQQEIIVFCRSGNRSAQAKSILERNGYQKVINCGTWQNVKTAQESAKK